MNPMKVTPFIYAQIAYLDETNRILTTTEAQIEPRHKFRDRFNRFYVIVPPPPATTRNIALVFALVRGSIIIENVRLKARRVGS
ncbi:hypothetical protein NXZ84_04025 [Mechercharimyces sp. CAU 1602]|nr:hypothetical protein [Mechercharimyces sp. CAU 1602]